MSRGRGKYQRKYGNQCRKKIIKDSREKGSVKVNEVTAQYKRAILRWRGREEEHSYSKF